MIKREKRFWKGAALVSAEMLSALVVFTGVVAGLVFMIRPSVRKYKKVDLKVFDMVKGYTNEGNNRIMTFFTFLGKHQFLIPVNLFLIVYFLFIRRHSWFSIRVASIALSSLGLMFALKSLFKRKRPLEPLLQKVRGLSFPSGHVIMSVTFYGLLIYIISNTMESKAARLLLIILLLSLMQIIGFSRVYLRVHYASDVAAGNLIGLSWLLTSLDLLKRLEDFNKKKVGATISFAS